LFVISLHRTDVSFRQHERTGVDHSKALIIFILQSISMKKITSLSIFLFAFTLLAVAQAKPEKQAGMDEQAIRKAIEDQRVAWNNGNKELFMNTYWQSDSLMFIGKSGVTYGWQNTLNNYKKGYPDTATMGKLDFDILEVKRLSAIYFFVVGKWHLKRSIGDVGGHFTLLWRKVKGGWVIVADHTS
jgi:ketosteroid isomerase-like protein